MITIIQAIILGIVQGITEWLPISSQSQVILVMLRFFNINFTKALQYSVWLHLGTVLAALIYFRKLIFFQLFKSKKLLNYLIITTIISGLLGFLFYTLLLSVVSVNIALIMAIIGILLIITGLIQKFIPKKDEERGTGDINAKDSILLGIVQSFSIFPGLSRSGLTTSFLLFQKFKSEVALKLSFLMSIPLVLGASIGLGITKAAVDINIMIFGVLFAFILGLITIHLLMKLALKVKFWLFCIVMGIITLVPLIF